LNRVREHKYLEVKDIQGIDVNQVILKGIVETQEIIEAEQRKKIGAQKGRLVPTKLG